MKIRFYGRLGEVLGSEIEVDPPIGTDTVEKLRIMLAEMFPDHSADLQARSRACIADTMVSEGSSLEDVDAIEFFPPLSGG